MAGKVLPANRLLRTFVHMSGKQEAGRRVTMKDLARIAGVNHSTVSRALSNHPRISAEVKGRIKRLAKEQGYRPDPGMSVLITHRLGRRSVQDYGKVAVLNALGKPEGKLPYYFRGGLLVGLRERAEELGYGIELFPVKREEAEQKRLGRVLVARGIRGVVAGPLPADWPGLKMEWREFSCVAVGYSLMSPRLSYVAGNHGTAVEMVYGKLKELGYRKIGFCDSRWSEQRNRYLHVGGYLRCLYLDGVSYDGSPPLLFDPEERWEMKGWVRRHGFDAVIVGQAEMVRRQLEKEGVKVPKEVGLGALSVTEEIPEISGVRENLREVGIGAMDLLHSMLSHGERGVPKRPHAVLVEGEWHEGKTTLRRRKAARQ